MPINELFRGLIVDHAPLTTLIPSENWWGAGSLTDENAPPRPFAVIRHGITSRGMAHVKRGLCTIWVHDELGDYSLINDVLEALYGRLHAQEHIADEDGNEIIRIEWQSDSGELFDPSYRTITKNTTFELIRKGV